MSRRERRLAFAALVVAAFVIFKLMVTPLLERRRSLDESLEAKSELIARYEDVLQGVEGLKTEQKRLVEIIDELERSLLSATTPTLASAELQSILEGLARQRGVRVQSVKTLRPEDSGDYTKILVEITLSSEIRPLLELLYDIENHPRTLSIVQMNIRPMGRGENQALRTVLRVRAGLRDYKETESTRRASDA